MAAEAAERPLRRKPGLRPGDAGTGRCRAQAGPLQQDAATQAGPAPEDAAAAPGEDIAPGEGTVQREDTAPGEGTAQREDAAPGEEDGAAQSAQEEAQPKTGKRSKRARKRHYFAFYGGVHGRGGARRFHFVMFQHGQPAVQHHAGCGVPTSAQTGRD
ncbi:MAG: hypothetical protein ACLRRT_07435 [Ruthenibacterium lactatiformans]